MYCGEEVKRLTTISECPSCDELSSYEDSCNCLSTLGCDSNILYIKNANTVKSDNVKTLGEVQIRFKQTECSSPSSPSLSS